jgi:L-rhamnose mutarotase
MRQAFTMKLKPGFEAEYKKRHDEIWPELARKIRAAGISNYSIFLDEATLTLFTVRDVANPDALSGLPRLPIVREWWDSMAPLMEVNPDNAPKEWPLKEVFYLA